MSRRAATPWREARKPMPHASLSSSTLRGSRWSGSTGLVKQREYERRGRRSMRNDRILRHAGDSRERSYGPTKQDGTETRPERRDAFRPIRYALPDGLRESAGVWLRESTGVESGVVFWRSQ